MITYSLSRACEGFCYNALDGIEAGDPEPKLFGNVPTDLCCRHTVQAHNKQGGLVGISFPTDLEKYMSARPFSFDQSASISQAASASLLQD